MPLGLFAGCPRTPTRKKSQIFKETAAASSAQEEAEKRRCRKGAAPTIGLEALDWPVSEPCELPCQDRSSRAQAPRAALSWRGWATSTPTLSAPKWLKSSVERLSEKGS
jgi:hypothetical protein